jgi:hypothetical protein
VAAEPLLPPPIVERPDGYSWIGDGDLGEFGPFETRELARSHRDAGSEEALTPSDTLADAEREIGGSAWPAPPVGEPLADEAPDSTAE